MKARSHIPIATYRLQLNHAFTFRQATEIVPYLSAIGISHCYISPCLKARPGSMHGYDIVDHNALNPEIGTAEDFDEFVKNLREHGMGVILDIVPNHMAIMGNDNAWWLDVIENGESSAHAEFFDIDWHPLKDELEGKVLVPVLHDHYGAVLESGELKLNFHSDRGQFELTYRGNCFPIDPKEYPRILNHCGGGNLDEKNPDVLEFESLSASFSHLPARQEITAERVAERTRDKEIHKRRLAELCARSSEISQCIKRAVEKINGDPADPSSFEELHELIKAQTFRLANWRVAADDINYRRFFDANDLAGIRVENEKVFQETHRLVLRLVAERKVDGLRIDHPDGLHDPAQYFHRLQRAMAYAEPENGGPLYIVIEKILTGSENLPEDWPVAGTTGYDFSNRVNALFVNPASAARFDRIYRNFIDDEVNLDDLAYGSRKLIVRVALASEVNVLANQLTRIALAKRHTCDFTLNSLRDALTEIVACFPVYRTYVTSAGASETDVEFITQAVIEAKWRSPAADTSIFDFVREVLLTRIAEGQEQLDYRRAVISLAMRFQQFSSPVMAKGLEDTAFYRYNRLVSLNEVGSDLHRFGTSTEEFHTANQERLCHWPHTMLATSTHDSKRSEDVRVRIDVLSEMPELWSIRVREWKRFNRPYRRTVNEKCAPSPNDEYLLYQTLIGAWPLSPMNDAADQKAFVERIENYMLKAMREAKVNTSWINRNGEYEDAVISFVQAILTPDPKNRFLNDFLPFQKRIARLGLWNSLSQTVLKLTSPGVPDIYQGNDLWDFSLVDPDNRRPVDYAHRRELFDRIRPWGNNPSAENLEQLLESPEDGRLKLYVMWRILCFRQQHAELFSGGEYQPLHAEGEKADHVVAFARNDPNTSVIVIVPRLIAALLGQSNTPPIDSRVWSDTHISTPLCNCPKAYRNIFTGQRKPFNLSESSGSVDLAKALSEFPVAVYAEVA